MQRAAIFLALVLAIISAAPLSAAENPVLIDFEGQPRGLRVVGQYHEQGLIVRAANWSSGPDAAVIFDSTNIGASEDTDLQAPLDAAPGFESFGELSPGNVMVLHERDDCSATACSEPDDESSRPAGWIEFTFAVPVTLHGITLIDVNYEAGEQPAQLVLFDELGDVTASLDVPGVEGQGNWRPWEIERSGITRARLYLPGDGAIDDLSFTPERSVNWKPTFVSHPPVAVSPEGTYRYRPQVMDADGDAIAISLVSGPQGMVVSPDGEISWSPSGVSGDFPVVIAATDVAGGSEEQSFTVVAAGTFLRIQEFELPGGAIVDDEFLADGLSVSARNESHGEDFAVVFDTATPTADDTDLAAPFDEGSSNDLGLGAKSPGGVLILHERHDCDAKDESCAEPDDESSHPAGSVEFRFTQPAHVWSFDVFDITSDEPAARTVELYDAADQVLASGISLPRTGSNDWDRLIINTAGVSRMRVNLDGDGALDNLRYALIGNAEPENRPPVIIDEEFTIQEGETLTIPAPGVLANDFDPDGDEITAALDDEPWHGSVVLNPDGSFVYTPPLGFTGKDEFEYRVRDAESASIAEDVEIYVTAPPGPAIIQTFTVTPGDIIAGSSALLNWTVENAAKVYLSPGPGLVSSSGNFSVAPADTTTYTLTAIGTDDSTQEASLTLQVEPDPNPPPVVDSFWLNDTSIYEGQSATLSWSVTGATTVQVNGATVAATGSLVVSPLETTIYTLVATNSEGETSSRAITLTVKELTRLNFLVPQEGALEAGPRPSFTLEFQSPTGGINPSYLFLQYAGTNMDATCSFIRSDRLSCRPDNPLPEGSATFTAFMNNGTETFSNIAVRTFQIDSTPPAVPDVSRITLGKPNTQNQVPIEGSAGAIEPGAIGRLRINNSYFHDLPVNPDGSFETIFTATGGTSFDIFAIDAAGLVSPVAVMQVPYAARVIAISEPASGALTNNNRPEIVVTYLQAGIGLDLATLSFSANDVPFVVTCSHSTTESRCIPASPLPEGANNCPQRLLTPRVMRRRLRQPKSLSIRCRLHLSIARKSR